METGKKMRLNRFIARCGKASRRDADLMIQSGRVGINGEIFMEPGRSVIPGVDTITLDDEPLELPPLSYFKCYKPRGVVTTLDDPGGRKSIADILANAKIPDGVVPAGRLDLDSEGLLILSNDGDLIQHLTHPSHEVEKVYRVLVNRKPSEDSLDRLRNGVTCSDYVARALRVTRMGPQPSDDDHPVPGYWIEIVMGEGRKREIREMLTVINYNILRLIRVQHGPITIGTIRPGDIRELDRSEIVSLTSFTRINS